MVVLQGHRGVVDQDPDGEGHSAERHRIDGLPEAIEDDDRDEKRERDRDQHDEGRTPAPEEEKHHDAREPGGDDRLAHHALDGPLHED